MPACMKDTSAPVVPAGDRSAVEYPKGRLTSMHQSTHSPLSIQYYSTVILNEVCGGEGGGSENRMSLAAIESPLGARVRPCGAGVRTSRTGVRSWGAGVRTLGTGVRPWVGLEDFQDPGSRFLENGLDA